MNIPVKRITIITVPLVAGQSRYSFGVQNLLKGKRIRHIVALSSGTAPNGETIASNAFLLNLKNTANETVLDNVASSFLDWENEHLLELGSLDIAWEISGVQVAGNITAGQVVALQIFFE